MLVSKGALMEDRRNSSKHKGDLPVGLSASRHDMSTGPAEAERGAPWDRAFMELDKCDIDWVVLRGRPRQPGIQGDVDLLIGPARGHAVDRTLARAGFVRLPPRGQGSHRFLLRVREHEFCAYEANGDVWRDLDVLQEVSFGSDLQFRTGLAEQLLARRRYVGGVATLHPNDEFWYLLLHDLLKRGGVPSERLEQISSLASMSDTTSPVAEEIERVSPGSAARLRQAALGGQWHSVRSIGEDICQGWRRRRPFEVRFVAAVSKVNQFLPARAPVGISVAILGPDGAGKTTLAASLRRSVPMPSVYVYLGVWRDSRFETTLRHVVGARLALRLLTLLGKSIWIQLQRRLGKLVLLDRYTSDAVLPESDLDWKGRISSILVRLTCAEPDLVIVLDAPAELMYERKGEQGIARLETSRDMNFALVDKFRDAVVLDASHSAEQVRRQAMVCLWARWAAKALRPARPDR